MSDRDVADGRRAIQRRTLLGGLATGVGASLAGCAFLQRGDDAATTTVAPDRARELAVQYAPAIYFDQDEQWFPTDPQPYETEQDGETVVTGFDALDGYAQRWDGEQPPDPAVFYNVVEYDESPLAVVQFWFYAVFDQFTTNFHWHDWELLQVFVDTEEGTPQLYVASSHSRKVPNNEFLDPDPERRPTILSELGSHSSGLSVNADPDRFQRLPLEGDIADITNSAIEGAEDLAELPLAYGLPRDEGLSLPFVVPELDGAPVYEHERLPSVDASDFVPDELTVRSFDSLSSPPASLPQRGNGLLFEHGERADADPDVAYELRPTTELEHIQSFTGPQLSFEFAVPGFAEDAIASHITTTSTPWRSPRYEDPASDITEPRHRVALADRYDAIAAPSPVNQVVVAVTNAVSSDDAPENEGLTTVEATTETIALLQSEPAAVPTFRGVAAVRDVEDGEHTLTVNGAGLAPHSEPVSVGSGETTLAGVEGEIPMVARESATKLELDPADAETDLAEFAVEDDFAGSLYDVPLSGPDAVYVHRSGAFTAEVRDTDDEIGAFRVNPSDEARIRIDQPATGKTPLARYLVDLAEETRAEVAAVADSLESDDSGADSDDSGSTDDSQSGSGRSSGGRQTGDNSSRNTETPQQSSAQSQAGGGQDGGPGNAVRGLAQAFEAVVEAARRAAERAEAGDRGNADQQLEAVARRLERVGERLAAAESGLPPGLANAASNRLEQARRRAEQAREAERL